MAKTTVLQDLIGIVVSTLKLPADKVDIEADLESLGINSLIMMELIGNIDTQFGTSLTPALFADVATLAELAALLERLQGAGPGQPAARDPAPAAVEPTGLREYIARTYGIELGGRTVASIDEAADLLVAGHGEALMRHYGLAPQEHGAARDGGRDLAIVGVACRLADAPDADSFWQNLLDERNSVRDIPGTRWHWEEHYAPEPCPGKTVSRWGALIDGVDRFDAGFFGISPDEAAAMDPQQRLFMQEAYHAVEDAGIDMSELAGTSTGVFVGYQYSEYEQRLRQLDNKDMKVGPLFSSSSPSYYLANQVSYRFDLRGPSESINVNCASSAVALNRACQSLLDGESDTALAGGVSLNLFEGDYIASSQYGLLSRDGSSAVFDDNAQGFSRGEGVAVVVLKRRADAERDGNRIYALVKSCHQAYRGAARSLSEVKHEAITGVLRECYRKAALDPATLRYVEVDGYATKWADSFEYEGIRNALPAAPEGGKRCALGSVKGNIGNVEAASAVTSVIKLALALHHKCFPATISKTTLSSFIDIGNPAHPLYIADRVITFDSIREDDAPIRAGVNSFADSGTNVHIVLEEHTPAVQALPQASPRQLFVLSAKDPQRLAAYVERYIRFLGAGGAACSFASLVYTAQTGRQAFDERLAIVAASSAELLEKLILFNESGLEDTRAWEAREIFRGSAGAAARNPLAGLITPGMVHMQLAQSAGAENWKQAALLWVHGVELPWKSLWRGKVPGPVSLPGYPFAVERHWIDVRTHGVAAASIAAGSPRQEGQASVAPPAPPLPAPHGELRIFAPGDAHPPVEAQALGRHARIALFIRQEVARQLGQPCDLVALDKNLIDLGMSSVGVAELIIKLDALLAARLSPSVVFRHPEIGTLAAYLAGAYPERADALVAGKSGADGAPVAAVAPQGRTGNDPQAILVPMRAKGGKTAIFAVPGAGGSALSLQELSHAMGNAQPFYCLEPAGLDGRSAPLASIEATAQLNVAQMKTVQPCGPYRLLGYSNGGVVAFEMARQLLEQGEKLAALYLIDSLCPPQRGAYPAEEMLVAVFNHFAVSLGGRAEMDVDTLQQVAPHARAEFLHAFLAGRGLALPAEQFLATFEVATTSEQISRAYRPARLAQKIEAILFTATDSYPGAPADYGWGQFLRAPLRVCEVKANHFSIVEKHAAAEVARKIGAPAVKSARTMARAALAGSVGQ